MTDDDVRCSDCAGTGFSPHNRYLYELWYGKVPFRPEDNGSTPHTADTPAVRAFAERNVAAAPWFYGTGEDATVREAQRLADLWNGQWSHHLNADDVAALADAGQLMDFTHTWTEGSGWRQIEPKPVPTPEQVNGWAIQTFGHDAVSAEVAVRARCIRERKPRLCPACQGTCKAGPVSGRTPEKIHDDIRATVEAAAALNVGSGYPEDLARLAVEYAALSTREAELWAELLDAVPDNMPLWVTVAVGRAHSAQHQAALTAQHATAYLNNR